MFISGLPTETVRAWQRGAPDAHGQTPERAVSDGTGNRCRHCLKVIEKGQPFLIVAHRPFETMTPYSECGPLFVCAEACAPHDGREAGLPATLQSSPDYLIKGYSADERIVYGTGTIVAFQDMSRWAQEIFEDPKVAFIHIRSARNNCYQARIDRSEAVLPGGAALGITAPESSGAKDTS